MDGCIGSIAIDITIIVVRLKDVACDPYDGLGGHPLRRVPDCLCNGTATNYRLQHLVLYSKFQVHQVWMLRLEDRVDSSIKAQFLPFHIMRRWTCLAHMLESWQTAKKETIHDIPQLTVLFTLLVVCCSDGSIMVASIVCSRWYGNT